MNIEDIKKLAKPIDELNFYISMFDIFKTKNIKLISGNNFWVIDKIIKFKNYFIPLDSVSMVEIGRLQISPCPFFALLLAGAIIPERSIFYSSIGFPLIALGFLGLVVIVVINMILPYTMTIRLNNGIFCTYVSYKKDFIQKITEKMQECINNGKGDYNFMLNQGKIVYNDNSINFRGDNNKTGDFISGTGSTKNVRNSDNIHTIYNTNTGLSSKDWANLEEFFTMRQKEFSMGDRNYKICGHLATYSQRKDESGLNKYLRTIGGEALKSILSSGTSTITIAAIKTILQKVISKK